MNRIVTSLAVALLCCTSTFAKDFKTLVVSLLQDIPNKNCIKEIKSNISRKEGVQKVDADLKKRTVTISYDAEKSTATDFIKILEKMGYKATIVSDKPQPKKPHKVDATSGASAV